MIKRIDILQYFTPAEKKHWTELLEEQETLYQRLEAGESITQEDRIKANEEIERVYKKAEERYIKKRKKAGILEDIRTIVFAIEKEDFLEDLDRFKGALDQYIEHLRRAQGEPEETLAKFARYTEENYTNCYNFIQSVINLQLSALEGEEDKAQARAYIDHQVSKWYRNPYAEVLPEYLPLAHTPDTDKLSLISYADTRRAEIIDEVQKISSIKSSGIELIVKQFDKLKASFSPSTVKLLNTAIAEFTTQNGVDGRRANQGAINVEVYIPFLEYARSLGRQVDPRPEFMQTPEDAEKERRRIKILLRNIRREIKNDADFLLNTQLKLNRKGVDSKYWLFEGRDIGRTLIKIVIGREFASYLISERLITQYPLAINRIDGSHTKSFFLAEILRTQYFNDKNHANGRETYNILKVSTLLKKAGFPSYDEIEGTADKPGTDRGHWRDRIKGAFEDAMEYLKQIGVLTSWEYCYAKKVPIPDELAYPEDYRTYENWRVHFEFPPNPAYEERLETRKMEKELALQSAPAKKKRTKKSKNV